MYNDRVIGQRKGRDMPGRGSDNVRVVKEPLWTYVVALVEGCLAQWGHCH